MKRVVAATALACLSLTMEPAMAQTKPLRIVLATHNASTWPLYIMQRHSWFGEIKGRVQVHHVSDFNLHLMGIMNEEFDITIHGTTPLVVLLAGKGLPLKVIRPLITPFHGALMATQKFESLKGKQVGYAALNPEQIIYLRPYLKSMGITEQDIVTQNMGNTVIRFQTLMLKQIDAAILNPPFDVMAESKGMVRLAQLGKYSPNSTWAFVTTNQKFAENNPELVAGFASAYDRAVAYFYDPRNREEMIDILMALVKGNEMTKDEVVKTYNTFIREAYFTASAVITRDSFKLAMDELVTSKAIPAAFDVQRLMIPGVSKLLE